jgi:hypothetical protein
VHNFHAKSVSSLRKDEPGVSANGGKEEMVSDSVNVSRKASLPGLSSSSSDKTTVTPTPLHPVEPSDLRFNHLQPSVEESDCKYKRYFGRYVAREAMIDEEYWVLFLLLVKHIHSLIAHVFLVESLTVINRLPVFYFS